MESKEANVAVLRGFVLLLIGILPLFPSCFIVYSGKRAEGERVLEGIVGGDCALGALHALRYAHQKATTAGEGRLTVRGERWEISDKETIRQLEGEIAKRQKDADPEGLYSAAQVFQVERASQTRLFRSFCYPDRLAEPSL